jgi:hypothetical protein
MITKKKGLLEAIQPNSKSLGACVRKEIMVLVKWRSYLIRYSMATLAEPEKKYWLAVAAGLDLADLDRIISERPRGAEYDASPLEQKCFTKWAAELALIMSAVPSSEPTTEAV